MIGPDIAPGASLLVSFPVAVPADSLVSSNPIDQ
jgi:hypothetical protein